jgi:hypothetical protein
MWIKVFALFHYFKRHILYEGLLSLLSPFKLLKYISLPVRRGIKIVLSFSYWKNAVFCLLNSVFRSEI